MIEWANQNKYNSFNSFKGLAYHEHYKKIVAWMDGKGELPPPIECNLDPIVQCNLSCYWCIVQRYLRNNPEEIKGMKKLPTEYMYRLVKFLADWGVKAICLSGGGEPTLNKGAWGLSGYASQLGMDVSWFTNTTNMPDALAYELLVCRWVALSIDSATKETYIKVKGEDYFDKVIRNVGKLADLRAKKNSKVDLCFKFAITPENQYEILTACKLAKELGVQDFHARPIDFERADINGAKKLDLDIEKIQMQFEACHNEETQGFHVYTIVHKYDAQFHNKHEFARCLATPLVIPILTDGNFYTCVDKKMETRFKLGSCYPNPENILNIWGSDAHRDLIKSIIPSKECSNNRCTWQCYHEQIEKCVIEDSLCLNFP